jgi:Na+/H+ antiporter NhaD/arsenite permease-like protein
VGIRILSYAALVGLVALTTRWLGWSGAQVLAATVFAGFIIGTLLFWKFRLAFALAGITALLAGGVLDIPHLIEFASLDVILFLVAMMIVIGFMEERRFFEVVVEKALGYLDRRAGLLLGALMILAALSAALVDEVTSILFMSAVTLQITRRFRLEPVPFLIMVVFATNIGSSATVVGNPIGVMIALRGGFTFSDFLRWATPIAALGLAAAIPLSFWWFRAEVRMLGQALRSQRPREHAVEVEGIKSADLLLCLLLFLGTVGGLILHHPLESWLGLPKNTMLLGVSCAAAAVALFVQRDGARELVERRVDWWTLTFFLLLFASAGTLRYVGATRQIAEGVMGMTGGREGPLLLGLTWGSAVLSAVMDNVLAVATLIPVLEDLEALGMFTRPLWWGMLFGGTFFGNLTMIGSTANIVALGILERDERIHVRFGQWLAPGAVVAIPTLVLATLALYLQLSWMR